MRLTPARPRPAPAWPALLSAAALAAGTVLLTGCAAVRDTLPGCGEPQRLAVIAQSVPGASYVPCLRLLPPGWSTSGFSPTSAGTSFLLDSDRSPGVPVRVSLTAGCRTAGATPFTPRTEGVLTYIKLTSTSPRYAGTVYDVFPGGCVSYRFSFQRGRSISLMADFQAIVGLYSRQQLRIVLKRQLGVELGP
jgi:hypothetical protein